MQIYEELQARGLIAQVTDEPEIRELVNNGKATFYIGFDPTADSLHVGHFMALCLMKRLQEAGNRPIALVGGGTGMIGDPSGRSDMRQMMTVETVSYTHLFRTGPMYWRRGRLCSPARRRSCCTQTRCRRPIWACRRKPLWCEL